MTINEMLRKLKQLEEKYGTATIIYFDCPNCNQSFTPNSVVTQAVHLKVKPQ